MEFQLNIGVSGRHLHLSREHMDILFGKDSELHVYKDIEQPGQFAAEEHVTLATYKGSLSLRVIGPLRANTQVELSYSDARHVGLKAPLHKSGDLVGTPGATLIGPCGQVDLQEGIIVSARHLHLSVITANRYGLKKGDIVKARIEGERALVFENVLVKTGNHHRDELQIDTDEANACGVQTGDKATIQYEVAPLGKTYAQPIK